MENPAALEVKLTNSASKITNMNYSYMQIKAHEQDNSLWRLLPHPGSAYDH